MLLLDDDQPTVASHARITERGPCNTRTSLLSSCIPLVVALAVRRGFL